MSMELAVTSYIIASIVIAIVMDLLVNKCKDDKNE